MFVYLGTTSLKRITVVNTQCREFTDEQFHVVKNTVSGAPAQAVIIQGSHDDLDLTTVVVFRVIDIVAEYTSRSAPVGNLIVASKQLDDLVYLGQVRLGQQAGS